MIDGAGLLEWLRKELKTARLIRNTSSKATTISRAQGRVETLEELLKELRDS